MATTRTTVDTSAPGRGVGTPLVLKRCTECQVLLTIDPARPRDLGLCLIMNGDMVKRAHRLELVTVEGVALLRGRAA